MLYYGRTISWDIPRGRNASASGKCGNIRGAFRKVSCIRRHGSPCVPNHRATGKKEKERIITMIMNPTAIKHVVVDGHSLTLESFVAISRYNATVELAPAALEAMQKSRAATAITSSPRPATTMSAARVLRSLWVCRWMARPRCPTATWTPLSRMTTAPSSRWPFIGIFRYNFEKCSAV